MDARCPAAQGGRDSTRDLRQTQRATAPAMALLILLNNVHFAASQRTGAPVFVRAV